MPNTTPRIHMLPNHLANQIAAGEVIERPASVVKELLENSLDAGANQIDIDLSHGGMDKIRITDNGCGIHPDDMLLALSQHATSKITCSEDLAKILTLGFRGEALASISAVSRLSLTAAQAGSLHAWQVQVEGRDELRALPAAHPKGCSVEVCDLFYNTPARRKFLRSARTEWQYTEEIIKRLLLSRYDVGFSITHNEKKWRYPAVQMDNIAARIAKVFSPAFIQAAHTIDANAADMQLTGFVANSDFTRSSYDWQYFYVNGRMVKDKLLQHAMRAAFGDTLHPGRYAAYVLYLTLDASLVDVNVHPTKHEVRFQQTRLVHDFIMSSVQSVLQRKIERVQAQMSQYAAAEFYPHSTVSVQAPVLHTRRKIGKFLTVLNQQVIITETQQGLGVVDVHAYYAYQAYCMMSSGDSIRRQILLTPYSFKVSQEHDILLSRQQEKLNQLGFVIDQINSAHWVLREMPAVLEKSDLNQLMQVLCAGLEVPLATLTAQLACCAIPSEGLSLSGSEIERVLDNTQTLPQDACCPHGLRVVQLCTLDFLREALCKHPQ